MPRFVRKSKHRVMVLLLVSLIVSFVAPLYTCKYDDTEPSLNDDFTTSDSFYDVNITIQKVHVIEDRDYLDAEIYVRASIDGGPSKQSDTYTGIHDGDIITLNMVLFTGRRKSYTIRVDVWESDEVVDDYLGHVNYTRDPPINAEAWYDAVGSIGGDNELQARVKIKETASLNPIPRLNKPPDQTFREGTAIHLIQWIGYDTNPDSYNITRDGELIDTGNWTSEVPIICNLTGLLEGDYYYHIEVNDTDGYWAEDSVNVTVNEALTTSTTTTTTTTTTTITTETSTTPTETSTSSTTTTTTTITTTTQTTLILSELLIYAVIAVVGIVALVVIFAVFRRS